MAKSDDVYIHPNAIVESKNIGEGTRIWAFVHILKGAKIGSNVKIGDHCFIENNVSIGNNVVIKNGVHIWDGVIIEDETFIGPNVVLTNELFPRSGFPKGLDKILIKKGATVGANSTIITGITLGEYCSVGAGSVVTRDVPSFALVYGNPAKQKGWVCVCGLKLAFLQGKHGRCACGRRFFLNNKKIELI